ncbi:MAG: Tad domain-containing protein [Firmicutes bacterium]|nr:Tad domain-containing protein [Bacillota bacterium]
MKQRFKHLAEDEQGNIVLMTCLVIVILMLFAALGTDFARAWVAREDMQTAVESAALAGSKNSVRYVDVRVLPGHEVCCPGMPTCGSCCEMEDRSVTRRGTERKMIIENGWRHNRCDKFKGITNRRIEYSADTQSVVQNILDLNWPKLMTPEGGGEQLSSSIEVFNSKDKTYGPSVVVKAEGDIKTTLLKLIGINEISAKQCSQSTTFYDVISGGWLRGRNDPPKDVCYGS